MAVDSNAQPTIRTEGVGYEETIYTSRFSKAEEELRDVTWKILCRNFLVKFINKSDTVLDLGAGDGKFILNIEAGEKIAVDLSSHVNELSKFGIRVLQVPATQLSRHIHDKVDVVFMSNFLEHMPDRATVLKVLEECRAVVKANGKVIILQPNIRYVGAAYWDYIDHHVALTEYSLREAVELSGFEVKTLIPRFLPYTAKASSLARFGEKVGEFFVRTYLRFPILWRIFGKQTFLVASPKSL